MGSCIWYSYLVAVVVSVHDYPDYPQYYYYGFVRPRDNFASEYIKKKFVVPKVLPN